MKSEVLATRFAVGLFAVGLSACQTLSQAEVDTATLFFPPTYKYVDDPRYSFPPVERKRALQAYWEAGADTLFEIVIDSRGEVTRSRLLRTTVDRVYRAELEDHAETLLFNPDEDPRFRAFFYPVDYEFKATILEI